jgi:hypothetical protein
MSSAYRLSASAENSSFVLSLRRSLPLRPSFLLGSYNSRSPLGTNSAGLTSTCASAATREQFAGSLQSGYLGVDCGDQFGCVHRCLSLRVALLIVPFFHQALP